MSDPFEKSLQGSSEFVPFKNMQGSFYDNASLCGQSEKIAFTNASFAKRQYERDQQDFKKIKHNMTPIQQQSENQFLNVGKWRDKKDKQLENEIKKLKLKASELQSSIFGKSEIGGYIGNSNMFKVSVKNESQTSKWDKKKSTQLEKSEIQQPKQYLNVLQEKRNDCIQQKIQTQEQRKMKINQEQEIEDQTEGELENQQQEQEEQEQEQEQQQEEEEEEEEQEQEEQQQEEQDQQEQENESQTSQSQSASNMQQSNTSNVSGQQSQKSWYQKKEKGNKSIAETDPQYKTEIMNDTVTTNNRPFSKWAKKQTQTGIKTEAKPAQQIKNLSSQLEYKQQKKQQTKNIPKNWYNIQKILLRINKLVSQ